MTWIVAWTHPRGTPDREAFDTEAEARAYFDEWTINRDEKPERAMNYMLCEVREERFIEGEPSIQWAYTGPDLTYTVGDSRDKFFGAGGGGGSHPPTEAKEP